MGSFWRGEVMLVARIMLLRDAVALSRIVCEVLSDENLFFRQQCFLDWGYN